MAAQGAGSAPPNPVQAALLNLGSPQRDLTPPVPQFPRLSPAGLECGIFTVPPVTSYQVPHGPHRPAAPPLAPAGGASPPCNSPLASRGGRWGSGVSKPPRPQVGWGSVAGHTTRQWTELERTLVGGKGVNTRPLRGRGLWAETQDAHALHGSPRGDASDPAEPREKCMPYLSACHSRTFPPPPSPSPSACTTPA